MRGWLRRVALSFWILLYLSIFHILTVAPLIAWLGAMKSAVIMSFAVGIWSSIFYLLLCRGYESDEARRRLTQLKKKQERGLLARIREFVWVKKLARIKERFSKYLSEELFPSSPRVFLTFIYPGPLFGVPAVQVAYSAKVNKEALSLIWAGCFASAFFWTVLVYGIPVTLARELVGILFGGG